MNVQAKALPAGPWLTTAAIVAITAASTALNAWGVTQTTTGLVTVLMVAAVISSEILGVTLASHVERVAAERRWLRLAVLVVLLAGLIGFNAWSGKRALAAAEAEQTAAWREAEADRKPAEAKVAEAKAAIAAVPALPANVPAVRLAAYRETRAAELSRLEPKLAAAEAALAALPKVDKPPPAIDPQAAGWIVALIEAVKVAALWAVGSGHAQAPAQAPAQPAPNANAARDLAFRRWRKADAA